VQRAQSATFLSNANGERQVATRTLISVKEEEANCERPARHQILGRFFAEITIRAATILLERACAPFVDSKSIFCRRIENWIDRRMDIILDLSAIEQAKQMNGVSV